MLATRINRHILLGANEHDYSGSSRLAWALLLRIVMTKIRGLHTAHPPHKLA